MNLPNQFTTCLGLFASLALSACNQTASAAEKKPPTPVKVSVVEARAAGISTRYSGSLEPSTRVDLAFRVGGYVEALGEVPTANGKRALDKGDFVKKGTLLARVRAADYAQKVDLAGAQISEARAQAKLAQQELDRAKKLFDADVVTKAELDVKIARRDSANAEVAGALARSNDASLSLSDTLLRAPMDGVVLSRQVEVGTLVGPGQLAITLAETRNVKAVFGVPQTLVEKLEIGGDVQIFVGAESEAKAPDKLFPARITRIAPAADSNGRVFSVEAALPNADGALRPGSVVSVRVPDAALAADAPLVPLSAIVRSPRNPRGFSVFVLEGGGERGLARLRDVALGEVAGNNVTVTSGLALGQRVVTVGATLLRDGGEAVVIR